MPPQEVREEVGVKVDPSFAPQYLGGWQLSKARDLTTNDCFSAFALRAVSEAYALDQLEVSTARWFSLAELAQLYDEVGRPGITQTVRLVP